MFGLFKSASLFLNEDELVDGIQVSLSSSIEDEQLVFAKLFLIWQLPNDWFSTKELVCSKEYTGLSKWNRSEKSINIYNDNRIESDEYIVFWNEKKPSEHRRTLKCHRTTFSSFGEIANTFYFVYGSFSKMYIPSPAFKLSRKWKSWYNE